jgi:hypothetical protein
MQAKQTCGRIKRHQFAIAIVLLVALLMPAIPVGALKGAEQTDSEQPYDYPYVGAIWRLTECCDNNDQIFLNPDPGSVRNSGILVAPNVVLTTGSGFDNGELVAFSAESPVPRIEGQGRIGHRGFVFADPRFGPCCQEGSYRHDNYFNMGVVILEQPIGGDIEFASLTDIGTLDALKDTAGGQELIAVGYGTTEAPPAELSWDFQRRSATWELSGLKPAFVHTSAPGQHGPAPGDNGGPILVNGTVAALIHPWDGFARAKNVGLGYRLDTPDVRTFLCFVSQTDLDDEQIENSNDPVIEGKFTDYPDVIDPDGLLAAYCNDSSSVVQAESASADDGSRQAADRPQSSKHKAKNGGKHRGKGKRGR